MRDTLGEFEQMVLLAILHLGEDVYGVPIVDEIARRTGREVAPAAVYITLRRLEEKGMLASWMGRAVSRSCDRIVFTNTYALLQPEVLVGRAHERFDADGHLVHEATRDVLATFLRHFTDVIALHAMAAARITT